VTYPDFAEALQARICADLEAEKLAHTARKRLDADERRRVEILEEHIAALEEAVAKSEVLGEQRRQEAETAAKRIAVLETNISTLQEAVASAESLGEQRLQEVQKEAKRADHLVAELVEVTGEFVEMSKRIAEQTAVMDKLRAELDDYRSRS
jgi:hypothetical protein